MLRKTLLFTLALLALSFSTAAFADAEPVAGTVNINSADAAQLALLPLIGEKVARRIVEYRTEHGPFRSVAELAEVKGIGEKTVAQLSRYVTIDGRTTLATKVAAPRKARAPKPSTPASK